MTCEDLAQLIGDYIDGHLEAEVHATLERHVSTCPRCGHHVETYRLTLRVSRALPKSGPLSAAFEQRLQKLLAEQTRH